jgi:rhodanese-related sulfurtransferase
LSLVSFRGNSSVLVTPRISVAPLHARGYYEARPGDVVGRDDLLVVDVRPERDLLGDFGHIHGVRQFPKEHLLADGLPGVSRETPVVVVCSNGRESVRCAEALVGRFGFAEVYHLVGGMLRWTAEARPIAKRPTWEPLAAAPHDDAIGANDAS